MEKEIKDVLDSMWTINSDFKQLAYPEPMLYGWKFDYGIDGWKNLSRWNSKSDKTYYSAVKAQLKGS